jgi:hypothetical protein
MHILTYHQTKYLSKVDLVNPEVFRIEVKLDLKHQGKNIVSKYL